MSQADIHLTLRRTGGLAGLPMEATLDAGEVDPQEAAEIAAALDRLELSTADAGPAATEALPDRYEYRLDVRRGDETHTLTFGERQVPEPLAPVIRKLMDRATPAPPGG